MNIEPSTHAKSQGQLQRRAHAPGRINLIGEHTDYNGGKVLPFTIQLGLSFELYAHGAAVPWQKRSFLLRSDSEPLALRVRAADFLPLLEKLDAGSSSCDLRPFLPRDIQNSWFRYGIGALLWHMDRLIQSTSGTLWPEHCEITVRSTLPSGAGISSSAALCVGMLGLLHEGELSYEARLSLARQAMAIEHQFAGTRCGLMDQTVIALGQAHELLLIDFVDFPQEGKIHTRPVRLHENFSVYRPLLLNTRIKHELGNTPYNQRRLSCEQGLAILRQKTACMAASLGALASQDDFLVSLAPRGSQVELRQSLERDIFAGDHEMAKRVAHAIQETRRVEAAVLALEAGRIEELASLIQASHESLSQDYEVSCAELDWIRDEALFVAERLGRTKKLGVRAILGARMTGGGFGGSTIQLVHQDILDDFLQHFRSPSSLYHQRTGLTPDAIIADFAPGLQRELLVPS